MSCKEFNTANNIIVTNRGDSYDFDLTIHDDSSEGGIYKLLDNDTVYLGIMDPHQPFEFALVKKKFTADDYPDPTSNVITIKINPEDTLDLLPGVYYYAVKLKMDHATPDGEEVSRVETIIAKTKFIICD